MYPPEDRSDQSSELLLAELIREQVLNRTRQEIPHSVEVKVKEVLPREDGLVTVTAEIWAETESQKGILIGKGGAKIGEIGSAARRSLEAELDAQRPPRSRRPRAPPLAPRRGPAGPAGDRVAGSLPLRLDRCSGKSNSISGGWRRAWSRTSPPARC